MTCLRVSTERVVRYVVQRHHETVVDIAESETCLVERIGYQVVSNRPGRSPVCVELDRRAGEHALAPIQKPDLLLGRVTAVQNRKRQSVEVGAAFDFHPLDREIGLGKSEARGDVVN